MEKTKAVALQLLRRSNHINQPIIPVDGTPSADTASPGQNVASPAKLNVSKDMHDPVKHAELYPFGLFEIVSGGSKPMFDIVAIHGLGGHREEAWTEPSTKVMWLRDLLSKDIPDARILTFGYDSVPMRFSGSASTLFLREHAQKLLHELLLVRQDLDKKRPILFIGHSLGGIVIKHALIICDQSREGHNHAFRSIKASTFAVLTFGTPHGGANGAAMQVALMNVARVALSVNAQILNNLKSGSEHLWQLNRDYLPIIQDFKSIFFYEAKKTSIGLRSIMIVDRDAATLLIKDSDPIMLNKDHITMVKFISAIDPDYRTVLGVIQATVRDEMLVFTNKNWFQEIRPQGNNMATFNGSVPTRRCTTPAFSRLSPYFCGRDTELAFIDSGLQTNQPMNIPARFAVYGISGLGKSQLIMQLGMMGFASKKYNHVFWIAADTEAKLLEGFSSILNELEHPDQHSQNQKDKITTARLWLEDVDKTQSWLLVIDNAVPSVASSLHNILPAKNQYGHVVMTTQKSNIAYDFVKGRPHQSATLALQGLSLEDATHLLLSSAGVSSLNISDEERTKAQTLVKRTGFHPLGISYAAAGAASMGSFQEILDWTDVDQLNFITEWADEVADEDQRVIKTLFQRQITALDDDPATLDLLKVLSFLDPGSISLSMLQNGANFDSSIEPNRTITERVQHILIKRPKLFSTVRRLCDQNLLDSFVATTGILRIHDLTCFMIQQLLKESKSQEDYFRVATYIGCTSFKLVDDPGDEKWWSACEEFMPHFQRLSAFNSEMGLQSPLLSKASLKVARYVSSRGRYEEAAKLLDQAVIEMEKRLGSNHPDTLRAMDNLAIVYKLQGRYPEAEKLINQALVAMEKCLGPEHTDTMSAVQNLAILYQSQGRYPEAEKLYNRALAVNEKKLGLEHLDTLKTLQNLATVLQSQGRYQEAEKLYDRALAGREKLLGPMHPNTINTVQNLANVYLSQGRYPEAETLCARALAGRETLLGPEHPDTLRTLQNLAVLYKLQDRYQEAEKLFDRVLAGNEKLLGPGHPDTLRTAQSLAGIYHLQGRFPEAESLCQQALAGREKVLGNDHPDTLDSVHKLATIHQSQGRYSEAETLFHRALAGNERLLGLEHPNTLENVESLAKLYQSQGRYLEAQTFYDRALAGKEKVLGPEHPETLKTAQSVRSLTNITSNTSK